MFILQMSKILILIKSARSLLKVFLNQYPRVRFRWYLLKSGSLVILKSERKVKNVRNWLMCNLFYGFGGI